MDSLKGNEIGRRSLKLITINSNMKPLGVCNSQTSYERKSFYGSLQKSPANARKTLFESYSKENEEFALCKELSSNRENTGNSPVVVHKINNSNASQEKKVIKPRRSMLGLRSKTNLNIVNVKDDATFTVPKPLQASSPNNIERLDRDCYNVDMKPLSRKSISTPHLTPFDDDSDTSAFFNKGISNSTWSVFKNVKANTYERPLTRGSLAGKARTLIVPEKEKDTKVKNNSKGAKTSSYESTRSRMQRKSVVSSVDQEVKLKWLAQKFQMEGNNLPLSNNKKENSADEYSSFSENESAVVDEEEEEDYQTPNKLEETLTNSLQLSPIGTLNYQGQDDNDDLSSNSADSYIQNETTILNSGKNNLEKIEEEENIDKVYNDSMHDKDHNVNNFIAGKGVTINIDRIMNLFEDLKNEKEDMDSKWHALIKQKEVFEKKWADMASELSRYAQCSPENNFMHCNSQCSTKSKKVVSIKPRHSFVSPKSCISLPRSSNMSSKTYSNVKSNFSNCRTPSSDKRLTRLRKSKCYTPNSLSLKVDNQAKDIFGDC